MEKIKETSVIYREPTLTVLEIVKGWWAGISIFERGFTPEFILKNNKVLEKRI